MALTTGLVQKITWVMPTVCVRVGASPSSVELFYVVFGPSDTEVDLGFKRNVVNLFVKAKMSGYPVTVEHPNDSATIQSVRFGKFNICPVGHAVHNDFYSVTGSGIPGDVQLVFDSMTTTVTVTPDLVRPHWVLITQLPASIPVGRNMVRLQSASWTSDSVPVEVSARPFVPVRVLYSGQPKNRPYNILFVANPGIQTEAGAFIADPVLMNRAGYQDVVGFCLRNLLTLNEDLLRQGDWDRQIRLVSVFDATLAANDANSLAHELSPNLMETRRDRLNALLRRYSEVADMVFVIHGSTTHDRASAWFTTDDSAKPGTAYTYDGTSHTHGHLPSIPGSAALPLNMGRNGLTPLHEYGHAGSDFNNGRVTDLYVDGVSGFLVNKKARAQSTDPIPASFANYNSTNFISDQNRDGLGYPIGWTSYHPTLIDAAHPNLMDNYWQAPGGNPQVCRLDRLTFAWFTDRLRTKLTR
jgi:hypothetical protein